MFRHCAYVLVIGAPSPCAKSYRRLLSRANMLATLTRSATTLLELFRRVQDAK